MAARIEARRRLLIIRKIKALRALIEKQIKFKPIKPTEVDI